MLRGQIFDDSPAAKGAIGQEAANGALIKAETAQADWQPILHESDGS